MSCSALRDPISRVEQANLESIGVRPAMSAFMGRMPAITSARCSAYGSVHMQLIYGFHEMQAYLLASSTASPRSP